ncbi:MAG: hypothetical protein K2N16_03290, partial [Muribaculaceae bacterium]|nr:hypothetical protein [Muribaculaceae bacterium]
MKNNKGGHHKPQAGRAAGSHVQPANAKPVPGWIGPALWAAYFVFAYLLLAVGYADYLRQWEQMSLFLPTSMFFERCMLLPGGLLEWAGTYLVQFFFHPWLGAGIYAALSTLLVWLVYKALGLSRSWAPAAVVPSAMLLLAFVSQGYLVYTLRGPGMPYANLIGAIVATASVLACRHIRCVYLRMALMLALVFAGYPFFGFYGLMGAGLCVLLEVAYMVEQKGAKRWMSLGAMLLTAAAIVVWPLAWHRYAHTIVPVRRLFISGLPILEEGEFKLILPYIVAYGLMAVGIVLSACKWLKSNGRTWLVGAIAVYAAAVSAVSIFKYDDENFRMTASLSQALMDGDWARAQAVADANQDFTPTRLNVLFTDIALMRQGIAGDKMFTYRTGSEPYVSPRSTSMRDAGGMMLSYHFGRIFNAYRWAMEYHVEYGSKVAYLKMMAKAALLMGEYDLARKYLKTLAQTKYHKAWAEKYLAYADQPELIGQDEEMAQIKKLMAFRDYIGGDGGKIESYLLPVLRSMSSGTYEKFDLSLM